MEQQQAHSKESTPYTTGYQEIPRDNDYFPNSQGQKLSPREHLMNPTAGQRLILAIVSLVILFLAFLTVMLLAASGALTPGITQNFGFLFFYMLVGLFVAVIVVNVLFNRKR